VFIEDKNWTLDFTSFIPENEKNSEALCTIGNGYMSTRGAFEESAGSDAHYPGSYMAGVYNILESEVGGRVIENEDFINCPNWTAVTFRIDDEEWFDVSKGEILEYRKQLNFKQGILSRKIRFKDAQERITTLESQRFVSMHTMHLAGVRYCITPENYSGTVTVRSALNGDIINDGVERYRQLNQLHLAKVEEHYTADGIYLAVKTNQSNITIAQAAANFLYVNKVEKEKSSEHEVRDRFIAETVTLEMNQGDTLRLDKVVAIYTSRDQGIDDPMSAAKEELSHAGKFDGILQLHINEWESYWKKADIEIDGGEEVQKILRFHGFHLLVTASKHNKILDADIPARGLHGEAYRGHIFWDELYVFPFFNLHFPEISRALLMYRYNRLDAARKYAAEYNYKGAMYPWQSGSSGREETQIIHLNPLTGEWGPDNSSLQRHVSLAIAYNVWMYYHVTDDREFLYRYGAEILFDIARFWASKATLNEETGRYEIFKVMGPNEYHEMTPGADEGGLKDNAYTNVLVAWLMKRCLACQNILTSDELNEVESKINITEEEKEKWRAVSQKINLVIKDGIISQYDGFLDLKELDWDAYRKKYGNIQRLDRLLKAEGLSPDDYQLSKQADLLMLFYVLPPEEISSILNECGYEFNDDMIRKNYEYYLARTSHGSTLSLVVHTHVASLFNDLDKSVEWYKKALTADIEDIQGGTVKEGIHAGLMGGTVVLFFTAFAGLDFFGDTLVFKPTLPAEWKKVRFNVTFRQVDYYVEISHDTVKIATNNTNDDSVAVKVFDNEYSIQKGKEEVIRY